MSGLPSPGRSSRRLALVALTTAVGLGGLLPSAASAAPAASAASASARFVSTGATGATARAAGRSGDRPRPGSAGVGDRLYPTLGNGGYDALHYSLGLRYATAAPSQGIDGSVVMRARATHALSRFDLDFGGRSIGSVAVDGRPAAFVRRGQELVITPARPIRDGQVFSVHVSHFTAEPTIANPDDFATEAFVITPDGSVTAGQPNQMHLVYPSNDHPRDKATFSFHFDVPRGETAVANGRLASHRVVGDRSLWTYRQRQPMATELTQLAVGRFTVIRRGHVGRVAVRDVVPTRLVGSFRSRLGIVNSQLRWMERRVGRYPFSTYGSLVVVADLGFALETQTLSIYDTSWFTQPRSYWAPVMLHELSHQWFGDSVAPYEWSDVWQNEGHATWYEWQYALAHGTEYGFGTLAALMREVYREGDGLRAAYGPAGRPRDGYVWDVFNPDVYEGGALVLYALQQKIGVSAFDRVERAWVRDYRGRSASTADFIALASRVSHRRLGGFLHRWLYGRTTPPMPGHPGWTVAPARASGSGRALPGVAPWPVPGTARP